MSQDTDSPYRFDGKERLVPAGSDRCQAYVRARLRHSFGREDAAKWITDQQLMEEPDVEGWRELQRHGVLDSLEPISLLKRFGAPTREIPRESRAWLFDAGRSDIYLVPGQPNVFFLLTHDGELLHHSIPELKHVGPDFARVQLGRPFEVAERLHLDLLEVSLFRAWRDPATRADARKLLCGPCAQAIFGVVKKAQDEYAAATIIGPGHDIVFLPRERPLKLQRVVVWEGSFPGKILSAKVCAGAQFNPDSFHHSVMNREVVRVTAQELLFGKTDRLWSQFRVRETIEGFSNRGCSLCIVECLDGEEILFAHRSELCGPEPPISEKLF